MRKAFFIILAVLLMVPSVAGAADRYVSTTGSGSTCSKASPCAIAGIVWADLAGESSTVYFFGGTYTSAVTVTGRSSPTGTLSLKPCSASPDPSGCDSQVIFQGSGAAGSTMMTLSNNTVLDGETSSGAGTRNVKFNVNGDYNGIAIGAGNANVGIKYVEFTGMSKDPTVTSRYVINASNYGSGLEISYNYFHDNWGHSDILAYAQTNDAYGKGLIHHNTIESGTINYITGGCGGQDIYNNTFSGLNATQVYDIFHASCGPGDNKPIQYIRFYNNAINPVGSIAALPYQTFFLEQNDAQNIQYIRIFNNAWDFTGETLSNTPISFFADAGTTSIDDVVIANNTFIKPSDSYFAIMITGGDYDTTLTKFIVENNIFSGVKYPTSFSARVKIANDTAASGVFDYNAIALGTSGNWDWINSAHNAITDYTSVSTFASDHATLSNNKAGSVSFVSSTDFHLQSSDTVAKDSGVDLSSLANMPTGWPFDKNGITRPQGAAWDIGAYEYDPSTAYPTATIGAGPTWTLGTGATATIH